MAANRRSPRALAFSDTALVRLSQYTVTVLRRDVTICEPVHTCANFFKGGRGSNQPGFFTQAGASQGRQGAASPPLAGASAFTRFPPRLKNGLHKQFGRCVKPSPSMGEGLGGGERRRNEQAKHENRLPLITSSRTEESQRHHPRPDPPPSRGRERLGLRGEAAYLRLHSWAGCQSGKPASRSNSRSD